MTALRHALAMSRAFGEFVALDQGNASRSDRIARAPRHIPPMPPPITATWFAFIYMDSLLEFRSQTG